MVLSARSAVLLLLCCADWGSPRLRLGSSVVQVNTPTGASTSERDLIAYPEGGGQLHLSAKTVPPATWLFVSVDARAIAHPGSARAVIVFG